MTEHLTDMARLTYSNKSMSMEPGSPENYPRGKEEGDNKDSEKLVSSPNKTKFQKFLEELDPEDRKKVLEKIQSAKREDRVALETTREIVNADVFRFEKKDILKMIFGSDEESPPESGKSDTDEKKDDAPTPSDGAGGDEGSKEPPAPPGDGGKEDDEDHDRQVLDYLHKIEKNTGEIRENTKTMIKKLNRIIDLTENDIKVLLEQGNEKLEQLVDSLSKVNWDQNDYLKEAEMQLHQDERRGGHRPEEMKWITAPQEDVRDAQSIDELRRLVSQESYFVSINRIIGIYKRDMKNNWGNPFGDQNDFEGTPDEFETRATAELQRILDEFNRRSLEANANLDSLKQFLLDEFRPYVEMYATSSRSEKEREGGMRKIQNIEELALAIMETHPDFGPDTDNKLLENGKLRQDNFIKWIRSQLIYYHNQDPDNPQMNFFGSISVDLPDLYRSVNVLQMINNPGIFFRDAEGNKLQKLQDEVTREVWLFGDIRNKNIAYLLSMPLDERIGEVLMNMYQNNVLTKVADEGKTPLYWLLTMSENFTSEGKEDVKVGMALNESLLMYYNLTDFPELYENFAGEDSPLFNLNKIKETVREILKAEDRDEEDTYFTPDYWGKLARFFNEADGSFKYTGDSDRDIDMQIKYVNEFLNIFAPEQNPLIINLVRTLVQKTIKERLSMTDDAMQFAETFSQFFLRFTLTAARADLGAPAMDAGEKVARIYNQEKGPNATNPGYANVKAVDLMRALAIDFFRGTYVLDGEMVDVRKKRIKDPKDVYVKINGQKRYLSDQEEIWTLEGDKYIKTENGRKVIAKKETFITLEEKRFGPLQNVDYKPGHDKPGNRILWNVETKEEKWDEAKVIRELEQKYPGSVDITPSLEFSKVRGQQGFTFKIRVVVRDWQLDDVVDKAHRPSRVIVRRTNNAEGYEIVQELGRDDSVVHGKKKNDQGETVDDTLAGNENIINKVKIFYDLKNNPKHFYELNKDETYDVSPDGRYIRLYKNGALQGQFDENNARIDTQQYVAEKRFQGYSTYRIMEDMHEQAMNREFQRLLKEQHDMRERREQNAHEKQALDEQVKRKMNEVDSTAQKLQYKADTMRQYSSNHLNRAFQMFHEMNQKHLIDVRSLFKGYDDKKGFVFDESQLQDIFTEQLYKRRRYAYRTYLINMAEVVRGISHDKDHQRFQTMRMAEHLFGPKVLSMFVMSNGEIDWEFLSTPTGVGELFKTELIMRLAAEEAQLDDLDFLEPRLTLQAKIAYRKALSRAIASDQKLDPDSMKGNKTIFNSFGNRRISGMDDENRNALDFMDVYEASAGNTERGLIEQEMIRGGASSFISGIAEAAGIFVKETVSGELD